MGGSTPPIDMGNGEWLLNYHGKIKTIKIGYGQSFMIFEGTGRRFPRNYVSLPRKKWIEGEADF
ncbi:MAG: hypothetical protein L6V93_13375 [Clostridiales bacterium]|nr:MAG: hypothetical protein L6V93_13375 [Clostridiales bacterium]